MRIEQASGGSSPIKKQLSNTVNGNVSEVGTREDLVAALRNNMLVANELELA